MSQFLIKIACNFNRRSNSGGARSSDIISRYADVAQLAEQLTCNQQVIGSSPIIGLQLNMVVYFGWVPEWPKGADCKSVIDDFEGSNPSPSIGNTPDKFANN